jgi:hypothetical protein
MRRSLIVVAALAATIPLAACGSQVSNNPGATSTTASGDAATTSAAAGPAAGDEVAWVDKVCGEIVQLTESQSGPPNLGNPDPVQSLKAFDQYITANIGLVDQTIADLKTVGPSPIEGGDEALNKLVAGLETLRNGYRTTKDKFATVNTNDPQAAQAAIVEAFTGLSQGAQAMAESLRTIEENNAIAAAADKAPNCTKLNQTAGTPTTF